MDFARNQKLLELGRQVDSPVRDMQVTDAEHQDHQPQAWVRAQDRARSSKLLSFFFLVTRQLSVLLKRLASCHGGP